MAVLKLLLMAAAVVGVFSVGLAEPDRRLRVQRAVCSGPPSEVNQVCRWTGLECACVSGTICSTSTNTCEVCQTSSASCTSPCQYPCRNGGLCVWETRRCQCPPEYFGVDCSTRKITIPVPTEETTAPNPIETPDFCGMRQCLNGGQCQNGACICLTGYYLPDCSLCLPHEHPQKCLNHCSLECKNGDCLTVHQRCHCSVDYTGEDCNLCIPAKAYMNCTNLCSPICLNGATCNAATRKCECKSGWMGETCHQPCPKGMFGPNCLQRCQCPVGSCDTVTGQCFCGPDDNSPSRPDCTLPCDCLVDGVCYSQANCPTGKTPNNLPPATQTVPRTTATNQLQDTNLQSSSDGKPPMMILVFATAAGAAVLLIVVVILIVCLVRTRRENTRKPGRNKEAERVPMTDAVAGNTYDDASSMPIPPTQQSVAPYRPTSGYEDVRDLHQNMPDLLQESSDISPYATTGNVTVHTGSAPSEYSYASVDELKILKEDGKALGGEAVGGEAVGGESYDKLDFLPRERSIRRPVVGDGMYGALQDDATYEDASSHLTNSPGYAEMSPSLNNRKALSLKRPQKDLRLEIQRKSASLKLPIKGASRATNATHGKETYENAYVGFNPKRSSRDANEKQRMGIPPPPPPEPTSQQQPVMSASPSKASKGEIPHYAKPNKRKSQQAYQQEVPQYAKPNKRKNDVPQYAKPNKASSSNSQSGGPTDCLNQLDHPRVGNEGKLPPAAGYAHLMHAANSNTYENSFDLPQKS